MFSFCVIFSTSLVSYHHKFDYFLYFLFVFQTGGARQQHLQRVDLVIYSDDDCEEAHPFRTFREYHICSGVPEGGKGQCNVSDTLAN